MKTDFPTLREKRDEVPAVHAEQRTGFLRADSELRWNHPTPLQTAIIEANERGEFLITAAGVAAAALAAPQARAA